MTWLEKTIQVYTCDWYCLCIRVWGILLLLLRLVLLFYNKMFVLCGNQTYVKYKHLFLFFNAKLVTP